MFPRRWVGAVPGRRPLPEELVQAWVSFDASTATLTVNSGLNFSSITDNAVGDFLITWQIAFRATGYCCLVNVRDDVGPSERHGYINGNGLQAGSTNIVCSTGSGTADPTLVCVLAVGRL